MIEDGDIVIARHILKQAGYRVYEPDRIRILTISQSISNVDLLHFKAQGAADRIVESKKDAILRSVGPELKKANAIIWEDRRAPHFGQIITAGIGFVMPKEAGQ